MESFLIVDNDDALTKRLSHYFGAQGFYIEETPNYTQAIERLSQHVFDVIITDVLSEDLPLEDLLVAIRENKISPVIIVMCGRDGIDDAIRAIRMGATDFIQKPINLAELEIKVDKGTELKRLDHEGQVLRGERNLIYSTKNFIGKSPAILGVLNLVEKVARTNSSVILIGETGTGKELLAGAIHYSSPRAKNAFVRVNCATLPDPLFESELFGHDRGAFTGAEKLRIGRFEQGNGGTVFLDEITDVSLSTQAKLLRVLQEREFERLGSNRTIRVDVRIISATNRDLAKEIAEGRFREDLYYRLNVMSIKIPPLREREGDIELLADFFLHKYSMEMGKKMTRIEPAAMRLLKNHDWPGNIRELENEIERA
ncbi:MAG TPA: sigma-54 dependent transcriptional regulator, partial [Spirochaetia bacterium]|nr:sigma-54 dependent transcriptional regulator [Spirochaetia bacterium]